jgi:hypothetical protein
MIFEALFNGSWPKLSTLVAHIEYSHPWKSASKRFHLLFLLPKSSFGEHELRLVLPSQIVAWRAWNWNTCLCWVLTYSSSLLSSGCESAPLLFAMHDASSWVHREQRSASLTPCRVSCPHRCWRATPFCFAQTAHSGKRRYWGTRVIPGGDASRKIGVGKTCNLRWSWRIARCTCQ